MSEEQKRSSDVEAPRATVRASLALEIPVEPFANSVRVLVLQHPQEPDKVLGSAALLVRGLANSKLKVGLSWPSLSKALGEEAVPGRWAVLYLGAKGKDFPAEVNFVNKKSEPVPAPEGGLDGIVVIDGTWSQAKALWWRNSWLLKLKRIVIRPARPSLYGKLRKEPRREAVSTIEAAAVALGAIDSGKEKTRAHLEDAFARMLAAYKSSKANRPPAAP